VSSQPTYIFDFDSTLVRVEALDELADIALVGDADHAQKLQRIREITQLGMEGSMSIEESLRMRLQLLAIRQEMLPPLVARLRQSFTASVWRGRERLATMRDHVWVVSSGFHEWIEPTIETLGLRADHVLANRLRSREDGVMEMDPTSTCAVDAGKALVIERCNLPRPRMMIGDGMTDWRVREHGACEKFICFTEVVRRDAVVARADAVASTLEQVLEL